MSFMYRQNCNRASLAFQQTCQYNKHSKVLLQAGLSLANTFHNLHLAYIFDTNEWSSMIMILDIDAGLNTNE